MRELGEGMKRIFNLMQENHLQRPELYSNGTWFQVLLRKKHTGNLNKQEEFFA
jgi:predicted HTH transcriptional regulator